MKRWTRILFVSISATLAFGFLTACSGGSSVESTTTAEARPFPQTARYVADMKSPDGKPMTIGISVDGGELAAYACNGSDDEAWFFGNQTDGKIDLTSRFRDTLTAQFDGADVEGDLTMNGITYAFTAAPVGGEAGVYTAGVDGVRAAWVVREDGSAVGVQLNGFSGTLDQADIQQLNDAQFRAEVRNKRQLQQAQQITRLSNGAMSSRINGRDVTPTLVTGSFRLN
ncbi:hypothetical protein AU184_20240 [Mycolicibacterium novocastrense]|uniref:hypothetical protein n=1 Tax=Mycolicibacterium novocastrense TaxID=59813 RepID=UPI000746A2F1|nr:hypothetical protein [Mycolicibacterium novocastrense]KUH72029.1 hypothetical protein AU072_04035 [Mycolicibacterium novocastrense]KUH72203.1 hypothetical protein AU183_26820 [Mycolicibacterium novocastrense]KUH73154.1 hypothetical protein AU184_20240 [Mycolicibacterium novocastrense]